MTQPFNLGTFRDILETYGANAHRWPDDVRELAEDFLKNSDEAQALYLEEQKLDTLLKPPGQSEAPAGLLDKILNHSDN